jgi:hypothetical protein
MLLSDVVDTHENCSVILTPPPPVYSCRAVYAKEIFAPYISVSTVHYIRWRDTNTDYRCLMFKDCCKCGHRFNMCVMCANDMKTCTGNHTLTPCVRYPPKFRGDDDF